MMYKALARIWHSADERYYEEGEPVDLSHLSEAQVASLEAQGVVEPAAKQKKARKGQEAESNGKVSVDSTDNRPDRAGA